MPGMNGWECLTLLKNNEEYKHIPVIIVSTSSIKEKLILP
jgi:CheY-like chemotaxis protein